MPPDPLPGGEEHAAGRQAAAHQILDRLEQQLEPTARHMVGRYRDAITDYGLAGDDFLNGDVYGVSLDALRVTVGNPENGRRLSAVRPIPGSVRGHIRWPARPLS